MFRENRFDGNNIFEFNAKNKDNCLLYLHKLNAWDIEIEEFNKHLTITATLPNTNQVSINLGHTFFYQKTTITHQDVTLELDPTSDIANLIHFVL